MKSFARHSMPRDFGGWNTHGLTQKNGRCLLYE